MKQIKILLLAVILTGFCSCRKNLLTVQPSNLLTYDQSIANIAGMTAYIAGMYVDMPIEDFSFNNGVFWTFSGNSASAFAANWSDESKGGGGGGTMNSGNYGVMYKAIRNVNTFIQLLNASTTYPDDVKLTYLAEAKFIRAYYYFGLVKWFGGVPLLLTPQDSPVPVATSTEVQVWDQIKKDLDDAALSLPVAIDAPGYGYGRANKWVALGLEARAMLHAGSIGKFGDPAVLTLTNNVNGVDDAHKTIYLQAAFNASAAIIASGKYSLYTKAAAPGQADATSCANYAKNFQYMCYDVKPGDSNTEAMLCRGYDFAASGSRTHSEDLAVLPYYIRSAVAGYYNASQPSLDLVEKFEYYDQPANAGSLAAPAGAFGKDAKTAPALGQINFNYHFVAMTTPFEKKDPRYHGTIVSNGTFFRTAVITGQKGVIIGTTTYNSPSGISGYSNYFDITTKAFNPDPTKFGSDPYVLGSGNSDNDINPYWKKKYVDPVTDIGLIRDYTSRTSWCDMRYGEILLTYAEASFELGGHPASEALNAINLLRARAGMPLYAVVGQNEIRHERMVELAYENKTWWDYIRWRSFATDFNNRQIYALQCYWKKKYVDPVTDIGLIRDYTSRTSWCDMRYGEILLTYAEASYELAQSGVGVHPDSEALNAINLLRARAGMPLYATIDQAKIRHERMVELAYENKTWWDYIRWRSFATDFTNRQIYALQCYWDQTNGDWVYIKVTNGGAKTIDKKTYYTDFASGDITTDPLLRPSGHNPYY